VALADGRKLGDRREAAETAAEEAGVSDETLFEIIELLFFAYRDFTSDPDEILQAFGFGRAHHRVLHFVSRNPGIRVTELLEILKITKQSLARVLRQLIEEGFVEQREGQEDRRRRLLHPTEKGAALAARLAAPQLHRIASALKRVGQDAQAPAREFLYSLINETERDAVRALIAKP